MDSKTSLVFAVAPQPSRFALVPLNASVVVPAKTSAVESMTSMSSEFNSVIEQE